MSMAAALVSFRQTLRVDRSWPWQLPFLPPLIAGGAVGARRYAAALEAVAARPDEAVALHVRLPFCPMLCSYCASDVSVVAESDAIDGYVDALVTELALVADRLGGPRDVVQLHLGGGTPNYLSDAQIERIVAAIRRRFRVLPETEGSIDCDPRRASAAQLDALRALGFSHVRFGMADLDPDVQRAVGRVQSPALMRDVCQMARDAGFETVELDMLHGLPGQSADTLRSTLHQVIDMAPDRVRCHRYVHRPGERSHQCAIGTDRLPTAAEDAALFHTAVETLIDAGYTWIGVDHFVLDTDELAIAQGTGELHCNAIGYTARPRAHVLGFGAGAVGDVDGTVVQNETARSAWQRLLESGRLPVAQARRRSDSERACCEAMVRLVCDLELRPSFRGAAARRARAKLAPFAAQGLVAVSRDGVEVTEQGHFALEQLCTALQDRVTGERPGVVM